jgi:hypothetical protein
VDVGGIELEVVELQDWYRFRLPFVAVDWLELMPIKKATSSDVHRLLEQQDANASANTALTLILRKSGTAGCRNRYSEQ